jgi:hypothetical protein
MLDRALKPILLYIIKSTLLQQEQYPHLHYLSRTISHHITRTTRKINQRPTPYRNKPSNRKQWVYSKPVSNTAASPTPSTPLARASVLTKRARQTCLPANICSNSHTNSNLQHTVKTKDRATITPATRIRAGVILLVGDSVTGRRLRC